MPRRAFTLLEFIVVLVVLAIMAALAVPTFFSVRAGGREAAVVATGEALARDVTALQAAATGTVAGPVDLEVAELAVAELPGSVSVDTSRLPDYQVLQVSAGDDQACVQFAGHGTHLTTPGVCRVAAPSGGVASEWPGQVCSGMSTPANVDYPWAVDSQASVEVCVARSGSKTRVWARGLVFKNAWSPNYYAKTATLRVQRGGVTVAQCAVARQFEGRGVTNTIPDCVAIDGTRKGPYTARLTVVVARWDRTTTLSSPASVRLP